MKLSVTLAGVLAVLLLSMGCSGDDTSSSPPPADTDAADTPTGDDDSDSDDESQSAGGASAQVTLGGSTYEMTETPNCTLGDGVILASFMSGDDSVSLTSTEGVVLVRMTLDGVDWVDTGSPPEPDVSDSGATWSGVMAEFDSGDGTENAEITIIC